MDPFRFTTIAHAERAILAPLSDASLDNLVEALDPGNAEPRVVDVGCGKGELLIRVLERWGGTGLGLDPNGSFLADAGRRVESVGVSPAIVWRRCTLAEAGLRAGSFDIALCCGATHAWGSFREAVDGLRGLVRPGGIVLVGDAHWLREPDPAYLTALGAERTTHLGATDIATVIRELGLEPIASYSSSDDERAAYEESYAASVERWAMANPADPEAAAFAARISEWRRIVRTWGAETLGFRVDVARRPGKAR